MRLLTHHHLDTQRVKTEFAKPQQAVARDDFKSPNLKKLSPTPYWRFKLDQMHRLLVQFARYGDETVCLALEVILSHDYASSRFLRGASLQWDQIDVDDATAPEPTADSPVAVVAEKVLSKWSVYNSSSAFSIAVAQPIDWRMRNISEEGGSYKGRFHQGNAF